MNLTLEVTGPQAPTLGAAARKIFTEAGGTIGRLRNNYWVLGDPWVSSHHAVIRFVAGVFYIEDTSTNGTFLNSPDNRLVPGQPHPIKTGDRIFIDPYQIQAVVSAGAEHGADPFRDDGAFAPGRAPAAGPTPSYAPILPAEGGGDDDNWLEQLGPGPQRPAQKAPGAAELSGSSPLADHYRPPAPLAPGVPPAPAGSAPVIPPDWFSDISLPGLPRSPRTPPQPAAPPPQPVPASQSRAGAPEAAAREARRGGGLEEQFLRDLRPDDHPPARRVDGPSPRVDGRAAHQTAGAARDIVTLAAVLEGAGIENVPVTPELAASFGQILRVVVSGVMDILQARQRIKNEFRMEMTSFKPAQNNPLKFSANVDDALHNLLVKRNPAFLDPVEAFEDAFDDLRNHQMAMLAGVRVAFDAMLAAFDPDALQQRFDREVRKGALINMPGKLRYWDQYCETIRGMVRDSETTFRELFGEEFAAAYEEQLARLKADVRARKP
jgi:type VI secretion system FHA domain protein